MLLRFCEAQAYEAYRRAEGWARYAVQSADLNEDTLPEASYNISFSAALGIKPTALESPSQPRTSVSSCSAARGKFPRQIRKPSSF